jgi:hypothetical protein
MSQWHYARGGQQNGPVTFEELRTMVRSGELEPADLVWNPSMKDWVAAGSVEGIFSAGAVAASANKPYATPGSAWGVSPDSYVGALVEEIAPGSEPIDVTACISRGFQLTKRNFLVLFLALLCYVGISIAITVPFSIAEAASNFNGVQANPLPPGAAGDPWSAMQYGFRTQFTPVHLLEQAVSIVVSAFLAAGFYRIGLNLVSGAPASVGQLFSQGGKLIRIALGSVLFAVPMWIGMTTLAFGGMTAGAIVSGVATILYVVIWMRLGFYGMAIVDRDLSLVESLKYSASITRNNQWNILGLVVLAGLLLMLGAVACMIGMIFTGPLAMLAIITAYRWMQYGRRSVMDHPGTDVPMIKR